MTDKPNWAEAPADATHWSPQAAGDGVSPWRKIKNDYWFRWVPMNHSGQWRRLDYPEPETYTRRPSTEEPDWRQAPSAATHVLITADGECQWRNIGALPIDRYIPRPSGVQAAPPTWDGQGLPPVGAQVEFNLGAPDGQLETGTVIGYDVDLVVVAYQSGGPYYSRKPHLLQPVLTAEQRAAAERREAVDEMMDFAASFHSGSAPFRPFYEALYDAGWRKTEGQ